MVMEGNSKQDIIGMSVSGFVKIHSDAAVLR